MGDCISSEEHIGTQQADTGRISGYGFLILLALAAYIAYAIFR